MNNKCYINYFTNILALPNYKINILHENQGDKKQNSSGTNQDHNSCDEVGRHIKYGTKWTQDMRKTAVEKVIKAHKNYPRLFIQKKKKKGFTQG